MPAPPWRHHRPSAAVAIETGRQCRPRACSVVHALHSLSAIGCFSPYRMGLPIDEPESSRTARKKSDSMGSWQTDVTYTFSFNTGHIDLPNWKVHRLPMRDVWLSRCEVDHDMLHDLEAASRLLARPQPHHPREHRHANRACCHRGFRNLASPQRPTPSALSAFGTTRCCASSLTRRRLPVPTHGVPIAMRCACACSTALFPARAPAPAQRARGVARLECEWPPR